AFLQKALTKQGMTILTGAGVDKLEVGANGVKAAIKAKDGTVTTSEFSHVIVAIGILPNTEEIGLEALGVETDRGFLKTGPDCQTNVP
ncbi:FAD-dependent oxidoreductase, partial [Rhizobium johnstonii]